MAAGSLGLALVFSGCTVEGAALGLWRSALLDRWLGRWGLSGTHAIKLLAVSLAVGAGAAAVVLVLTGLVPLATVALVAVAPAPFARASAHRRRRAEEMSEAWPDAISSIIAGVRAGMSLPECCCALTERGPAVLHAGFAAFASTYRACMSFEAALDRLRDTLDDPVTDRVVMVLRLANDVGGTDLVRVLGATGDFIREDLRTRGEIRARWSWTVNAARLAAATPFLVLFLMGLRPEARLAYAGPGGVITIAVGSVVTLSGYRLMLRAARLPQERRLG